MTAGAREASRAWFPGEQSANVAGDGRTWAMRGANFVVLYSEGGQDAAFPHPGSDEHFLFLPDACGSVLWNGQETLLPVHSLVIVPPGDAIVKLSQAGRLVRILSADDFKGSVSNSATYDDGAPEVRRVEPGPEPIGPARVRVYAMDDYADRPMRPFRSRRLMVNIFDVLGPRDTTALTPHSHTDFEQGSLAMSGDWVHDLRWPWTKDLSDWREDEHLEIGSPSLLVIPAGVIHTSRAVSWGPVQLVDIFSPPREDFDEKGWVCNADDYPSRAGVKV